MTGSPILPADTVMGAVTLWVADLDAMAARAVRSVAQKYPGTFTGSADHLVSKAFYFNDPEGNGVELYWDRDRTEWSWVHGTIEMDTIMLNPMLGLGNVEIKLGGEDQLAEAADRLAFYQQEPINDAGKIKVNDPWGSVITLEA